MILEQKVKERTQEIVRQKEIVEQKNKDITDSINYAKNIQEAILPDIKEFQKIFNESFILYKPRDIVSGDFFWLNIKRNKIFVTAADCTGHGVPGAFMSILGISFLNEIVNNADVDGEIDKLSAAEVLNRLRAAIIDALHQKGIEGEQKDGMDMSLCLLEIKDNKMYLQFAGANNPLYIVRNGELLEYKPDKMPIGYYFKKQDFTNNEIEIKEDDFLYMFSDGYADQFGGPKGKKFKYRKLKDLFTEIYNKPATEQQAILELTINKWMGNHEQIDDILIIGIKIPKIINK
jgi:serine phosphatase RsbU (regulator of sigma subunit)